MKVAPKAEIFVAGWRQHGASQTDRNGEPLWRGISDSTRMRTPSPP